MPCRGLPDHRVSMPPCRQFRKEEDLARRRGEYSPPGLLNVDQFIHAFKKLSIRVSEEQATALFIKYGCDAQVMREDGVSAPCAR